MTQTMEVLADDRALDALVAGRPYDDDVFALLAALRFDCQAEEQAAEARAALHVVGGSARRRVRHRVAVAVVAGAALAGISLGGVSAAASQATPGSGLWGVSRVLYPSRASSLEAKDRVQRALADARRYERSGRLSDATTSLGRATRALPGVHRSDGADNLRAQVTREGTRLGLPQPRLTSSAARSAVPSPSARPSRSAARHAKGHRRGSPSAVPSPSTTKRGIFFSPGPSPTPVVPTPTPTPTPSGSGSPSPSPSPTGP